MRTFVRNLFGMEPKPTTGNPFKWCQAMRDDTRACDRLGLADLDTGGEKLQLCWAHAERARVDGQLEVSPV